MKILILIAAFLFLSFLKHAEKQEKVSESEWLNSLNTAKNRKIAKIITYIIIIANLIPLGITLWFMLGIAMLT